MVPIWQGRPNRLLRTAAVGMSTALLLAAATLQAATGSQAATAHAASAKCHIVVTGAPWSIRSSVGRLSGNRYTLVADSPWCTAGRPWVVKFTHQTSKRLGATLTGPRGLKCHSLSTSASGDSLVYTGVCGHATGYKPPGFGWAPQIRR
jgi:hypothetical protein